MTTATKVQIGTHSGSFHCDEALACFLIRQTDEFKGAEVVRSRDPSVLSKLPCVVDVGGVYDPANNRFDHHQKGFEEHFGMGFTTKLSSAGLVYKHFGLGIIQNMVKTGEEDAKIVFKKVYAEFVEALDAIDNGISQYPKDAEKRYNLNTDLSSRVGKLNPRWNEKDVDLEARFELAMELAGSEFLEAVNFYIESWLPARELVKQALACREEHHSTGEVMVLKDFTIWKSHLFDLEREEKIEGLVKYCLYQDSAGKWRIQAVPVSPSSFQSRVPLPAAWRGIRDDILSKESGIPGCIFVHASGFIGGNQTFEGVMTMAVKALELRNAEASPKSDETEPKKAKTEQ